MEILYLFLARSVVSKLLQFSWLMLGLLGENDECVGVKVAFPLMNLL